MPAGFSFFSRTCLSLIPLCLLGVTLSALAREPRPWLSLFDGQSLQGWKAAEHAGTFSVHNSEIVAHGPRSHLFYTGPIAMKDWTDFELSLEVWTEPGANSGVYFHTRYQETGIPEIGYQIQINNSNPYPSKTGSIYGVEDRLVSPVGDNEWFTLYIRVEGKRIVTKINGAVISDYIEPANPPRSGEIKGSLIAHGTIALQGHDADSMVRFRNIRIRLPQ